MVLPLKKLSRSFTLIELLIVVSIITIVAGVTIPSFTGYMKNLTLKNGQEQLKSDLRSIQNLALTGSDYDTDVTWNAITGPARYWIAKWAHSGSSYQNFIVYDIGSAFESTCANISGASVRRSTFTLPGGITFDRSTSGASQSTCAYECLFFNMQNGSTRFVSVTATGSTTGCNTNNQNQVKIILKNESGSSSPVSWNRNGMLGN